MQAVVLIDFLSTIDLDIPIHAILKHAAPHPVHLSEFVSELSVTIRCYELKHRGLHMTVAASWRPILKIESPRRSAGTCH